LSAYAARWYSAGSTTSGDGDGDTRDDKVSERKSAAETLAARRKSKSTVGAVPGVSPLQRAPTPASALRGAFIPGALTDEGFSEQAVAVLRGTKGSPKKFSAFLRVIRGLRVEDALIQCDMSPKRVAKTVGKVILSAIGNGVNNQGLDRDRLVISEAVVGKGQYLRRVSMHGRGRSGTMHRPRSHVTIKLEENDTVKSRVQIHDEEMPWVRRRRLGREKDAIAKAAGIV
jgi:large subunit ribosomal protein L22